MTKANTQIKSSSPIVKEKRESTKVEEKRGGDTEVRVLRRLPRGLIRFYRPRFLRSSLSSSSSSSSSDSSSSSSKMKIDPVQVDVSAEIEAAKRSSSSSTLEGVGGGSSSLINNDSSPRPLSSQFLLSRLRSLHAPVYGKQAALLASRQREEANAKKARPVRAPPPLAVDSQGRTFGGLLKSAAESAANASGVYRVPGFNQ